MVVTGNDPHINMYNTSSKNIAPAANGQSWIVSVYIKASVTTTGEIFIFGAAADGNVFDAVTGQISAGGVSIGTDWTRVSYAFTFTKGISFIQVRLDGPNTGGTGQTLWWDGLQVERVPSGTTTPTPFTSSYYGGSVYKDLVGSNNGTLTNYPTYSADNNGSFLFNSTGPRIVLTQNAYGITDTYTVSFWVKRIGGTGVFLYIGMSGSSGMYFENYTNTDLYTWFFGANSPQNTGNWGTNALSTTSWVNITMVMVTSSRTQTRYINGLLSGSTTLPNAITAPSASGTWRIVDGTQTWTGYINDLKIYNRALTAAEIQQNYNATKSRYT